MLFSYRSANEHQQEILSGFNTDEITEFQEAVVKTPGGRQRILVVLLRTKRPAPTPKEKFATANAIHEIYHADDIQRFYALPIHSSPDRVVVFFEPDEDSVMEPQDEEQLQSEEQLPSNVVKMHTND